MELVESGFPFSFDYPTYDQNAGLIVGAKIYDVSSGTPSFLQSVSMPHVAFGIYSGNFTAAIGKTYFAICSVFSDSGLTTPDASRAASASSIQSIGSSVTFLAFDYTDPGQSPALFARAGVYDTTSGTPIFVQNIVMAHVALGAYFGSFNGSTGHSYQIGKIIYLDGTYATPDPIRPPLSSTFQCAVTGSSSVTNILAAAVLEGSSGSATLEAL